MLWRRILIEWAIVTFCQILIIREQWGASSSALNHWQMWILMIPISNTSRTYMQQDVVLCTSIPLQLYTNMPLVSWLDAKTHSDRHSCCMYIEQSLCVHLHWRGTNPQGPSVLCLNNLKIRLQSYSWMQQIAVGPVKIHLSRHRFPNNGLDQGDRWYILQGL